MAEKLDPKEIVTPWPSSYMTPRLHWATSWCSGLNAYSRSANAGE